MGDVDVFDLESVSQQYGKFLEHLHIPESKRDLLEQQPVDIKRQLLQNHQLLFRSQRNLYRQDAAHAQVDAFNCVHLLDQALLSPSLNIAALNTIRTQICCGIEIMSAEDDAWLRCFLELRGLDKLVSLMTSTSAEHVEVVLQCTKALLGSDIVLRAMCESEDTVARVLLNVNSEEESITAIIVEIILVIGFYSAQGYDSVLHAFDSFQAHTGEPGRFFTFVDCLENDQFSVHLKADAVALINILVGSPQKLEDRMRIRADFVHAGLMSSLDDLSVMVSILRSNKHAEVAEESQLQKDLVALEKQIQVFHTVAAEDHAKVIDTCNGKNLSDPSTVLDMALRAAVESGQTHNFLRVLHALLVIPSSPSLNRHMWSTIAKACQWLATNPKPTCSMSFEVLVERLDTRDLPLVTQSTTSDDTAVVAEEVSKEDDTLQRGKDTAAADAPQFAKYQKMRKVGLPEDAIRHAFEKDGVDPPPGFFGVGGGTQKAPAAKANALGEKYTKYLRMQKAGLPEGAILNAMQRDSIDPAPFLAACGSGDKGENASLKAEGKAASNTDPKYAKYVKMLKAGLPEGAILNAMKRDNVDPSGFDFSTDMAAENAGFKTPQASRKQNKPNRQADKPKKSLLPPKPKVIPQVPMRGLFWSKLDEDKVKGSFWEAVDEASLDIKPSLLESMFCQKPSAAQLTPEKAESKSVAEPVRRKERALSSAKSLKKFQSSTTTVELLDPKRQQNLGIAFARYKLTPLEFKQAVVSLDLKKIGGMDRVATLDAFVPTQEEKIAIEEYSGDTERLGTIEQLFHMVLSVPRFKDRVRSWNIKLKYHIKVAEVQESVQEFDLAVQELHNSQALYRVLEIVLALGNYLNGSSARGGAHGFCLDTLTKLGTIKSVDNQTTLLRFIVAELGANKYKEILRLPKELRHVSEAANLDYSSLKATIKALTRDLALVEKELEQCQATTEPGTAERAFIESFEPFVVRGRKLMKIVQEKFDTLETSFDALLQKFGEKPSVKTNCAQFFKTFSTFVKHFAAERQNCLRNEEIEAKRRSKSVIRRKSDARARTDRKAKKPESGQVFDKMLSSANAGNATDILSEIKKRRKDYDRPSNKREPSTNASKRRVYQSVGATMSLYKSIAEKSGEA